MIRRIRPYWAFARTAYYASLAYPSALFMHTLAHVVMAIALFYLWQAILASGGLLQGFTFDQLKIYLLFGLLTNTVMAYYSESRIASKVTDGTIATDLLRPIDFQVTNLAETIGRLVIEGSLAVMVVLLVAFFFGGVPFPPTWADGVYSLISLGLGMLVKFALIYCAGLICFWTTSSMGITWLRTAVTNLFSGAIIPPSLFPAWLATLAAWLPFQGIVTTPAQLYLGQLAGPQIGVALLLQGGWCVLLWLLGRALWRKALHQLDIHGG